MLENGNENEDKFIKENPIIFNKYKVIKKLKEGSFGVIYLGKTLENNVYVALKVEKRKIFRLPLVIAKNSLSLKRFLKHLIINMPHIFGNMVYLNIKERDRF